MTQLETHLRDEHSGDEANVIQVTTQKFHGEVDAADIIVDVVQAASKANGETHSSANVTTDQSHSSEKRPNGSGALVVHGGRGNFSSFLAPLNQETFKEVVSDVEDKLKVINQTLSMLDAQGFDVILEDMLESITLKTGELLNADRTTIWLLDEEKEQLYTIVAQGKDGKGNGKEIRIPMTAGIAGEAATKREIINIPYDFFDDPRSEQAKIQYKETGYRTYTMLTLPLINHEKDELVAVVQLMNKKLKNANPAAPFEEQIEKPGFTEADIQLFREFAPSIRLILESSRSFYIATQRQRAANALIQATQSLSKGGLDLEATLANVMDEAKKLMNADRSTLWLIDEERDELWTKLPINGELQERRIPRNAGFAGKVATTGETILIPFDLYDHPDADTSKAFDKTTGYRTCSILCMPVFNADGKLIGVTQLINKIKQGYESSYDPATFPEAPECWKASFNRTDEEFMKTFNIQAGVALQNAKLFAEVKQQQQMQRDILTSLTNGVISTDKNGKIIAANESAKQLLGFSNGEPLEGKSICDLIRIEKGDFKKWFQAALEVPDEKSKKQYYPDQTLQPTVGSEQHSVNLSINTMFKVDETNQNVLKPSGVLVVMDDISDEKRLKSTMYRYMSAEVAEQLLENPDFANKMGGDRKEVSVLFSDIRSYTTITEGLTAEEVVRMLNKYFESMVDAVFEYKGTLDKYIGDAIMAVYGSPLPLDDHEWMAVQTAIEMRHRLVKFNEDWVAEGHDPIRIGIGINSDVVISGNIGSSKRTEFTAIGDGVNLGSRLESASKQYGTDIVISEYTYKPCADRVWARELDFLKVKGKTKPVSIYELVELRSTDIPDEKKYLIEHYEKGLQLCRAREFPLAMAEFGTAMQLGQQLTGKIDVSSKLYLDRCSYWLQNPPPEDWDGSWEMKEK
ncbi:MAG: GAF domain-containing protein [Cyanobacteria bacterium]|nr:GAF domain-containing protein [Cyanobacteriota bacterium]MDW8199773.1 GAF domain-containing protein [Cyanobacteriota bacterium SKYGB_h_bin112]